VQLGVGAAFSFITGKVKEAPKWMQKTGLEWLYRMPQEPKKTIYRMSLVPRIPFENPCSMGEKIKGPPSLLLTPPRCKKHLAGSPAHHPTNHTAVKLKNWQAAERAI